MDWTPGPWSPGAVRAFRLNSRAFCLALDALARVAPDEADRVMREVNDYARSLRPRAASPEGTAASSPTPPPA